MLIDTTCFVFVFLCGFLWGCHVTTKVLDRGWEHGNTLKNRNAELCAKVKMLQEELELYDSEWEEEIPTKKGDEND